MTEYKKLLNGPKATLPDKTTIEAKGQGILKIHKSLPIPALVYPKLTSESLLSIGQLCDQGCVAVFQKEELNIYKNNQKIISGTRNRTDGLWDVPFPTEKNNYIITRDKSKTELAQFLHGCAFSPSVSTFQRAISNGNFITWPGIDTLNFKKLLGTPEPTLLGHLDQERKNL